MAGKRPEVCAGRDECSRNPGGAASPKLTAEAASKFFPLIVSVNAAPPATPLFGEIVVIVGLGFDAPGEGWLFAG